MTASVAHGGIRRAPKALLHDHLDGGLRPATVIELAAQRGYRDLPSTDLVELSEWFRAGADRKDLPLYLETFTHTLAVMQSPDELERVATEAVVDLASDGVVYAELRYAPEQHQRDGLTIDEVVAAVERGLTRGCQQVAGNGQRIVVSQILCAMRQLDRSRDIAEAAVRLRDQGHGVVGFDLAGPEVGFPARDHQAALQHVRDAGLPLTLHASESLDLVAEALAFGADRIGHGVRLGDELVRAPDGSMGLGEVGARIRDAGTVIEVCPSSHVHIGAVKDLRAHPIDALHRAGVPVTIDTDNRLMSGVSATSEQAAIATTFGWEWSDLERVTRTAIEGGFADRDERRRLVDEVVAPAYAALADRD